MNQAVRSFSMFHTDVVSSRSLRIFLGCASLTVLMSLGAVARMPLFFTPVPLTLQTFFLVYGALALRRRSLFSIMGYLILGAAGLPVFTNFAYGPAALMGPTAGYLFGFLLCALILSFLVSDRPEINVKRDAAVLLLGMLSCLIPGMLWLKILTGMNFKTAFLTGFLPFVAGDIAKISLAYILYRKTRLRLQKLF
ncbi:biotin transporter BioY [Candidatus Sumerlaeota bacterium]|nr:biotin transporter BioY [Candidatus Sumerlaeota bacterium]